MIFWFISGVGIGSVEEECCTDQSMKYKWYGYENRKMSPAEYFLKLTDYTTNMKELNYIQVS